VRSAFALLVVVASTGPGRASSFNFAPDFSNKSFVLAGADIGLAIDDEGSKWLVGGEASAGRLDETHAGTPFWYGAYVDLLVDGRHDHARISLGAEVGFSVLGLDVGPVLDLGGDGAIGFRTRGALSIGVVSLYLGPVLPVTGEGRSTWVELGLLLKFPHVR
jgi:hypothetical protein